MTLIFVESYTDDRDRLVHRYHAPSSTRRGKVYVVDNLVGTDVWSCGPLSGEKKDLCEASRYKKTCRHVPNGVEPPDPVASNQPDSGHPTFNFEKMTVEAPYVAETRERLNSIEAMIEELCDEDATYRRLIAETKSGPFVIWLLHIYFGLRIIVPDGESMESYLMGLPQFSSIRTAAWAVRKKHEGEPGWEAIDPQQGQERRAAYAAHYGGQKGQTSLMVEGG